MRENICNHLSGKGWMAITYKQFIKLNSKNKQTKKPKTKKEIRFKKWEEDLNRHFSKEDTQMPNKYTKRCLVSLIIREMQIKASASYHLIPLRMVIIEEIKDNESVRIWRNGNLYFGGGTATFKNSIEVPQKIKNRTAI